MMCPTSMFTTTYLAGGPDGAGFYGYHMAAQQRFLCQFTASSNDLDLLQVALL